MKIVLRKLNCCCSDILLQTLQFRSSWNWNDPRLLRKQPGKRDLSRRGFLPFCDLAKHINQRLICFSSLRRKTRERVAKVRTVERSVFVHLSREVALSQRAVRNETDPELLKRRQQLLLRISEP